VKGERRLSLLAVEARDEQRRVEEGEGSAMKRDVV
jgi:hypothetical protein